MGCTNSTQAAAPVVATNEKPNNSKAPTDAPTEPKKKEVAEEKPTTSHCPFPPPNEYDDTIDPKIIPTTTLQVGPLTLRYAAHSQRGRDPDCPNKPNQDRMGVVQTARNGAVLFGVYDGHGPFGHECAQFASEQLPLLLFQQQQQTSSTTSTDSVRFGSHQAHVDCNHQLRESPIDDQYSGTTAVSLYVHPQLAPKITISNVGDSRAILGTTAASLGWLAVPLTKDQTPNLPQERERCKKAGARILSFGQIQFHGHEDNNNDVDEDDPPRIWSPHGKWPGTAFTRSIGDATAEPLGVFSEPEILTLPLSYKEKVIILASDGIFDVLSNPQVLNLAQHYSNDPVKACKAIVDASHEEWLRNEDCLDNEAAASYDDMTVMCIYIGEEDQNSERLGAPRPAPEHKRKRVRQKTLRNLEEMGEGMDEEVEKSPAAVGSDGEKGGDDDGGGGQ